MYYVCVCILKKHEYELIPITVFTNCFDRIIGNSLLSNQSRLQIRKSDLEFYFPLYLTHADHYWTLRWLHFFRYLGQRLKFFSSHNNRNSSMPFVIFCHLLVIFFSFSIFSNKHTVSLRPTNSCFSSFHSLLNSAHVQQRLVFHWKHQWYHQHTWGLTNINDIKVSSTLQLFLYFSSNSVQSISYYHAFRIQSATIPAYAVVTFDSVYRVHMMTYSYAIQVLGNKTIELANVVIHMWTFFCNFCFHELLTCWIKLSLSLNHKLSHRPKARMKEGKSQTCWTLKIKRKSKEKNTVRMRQNCMKRSALKEGNKIIMKTFLWKEKKNEKSSMKKLRCRNRRKKAFHAQINE